MRHPRAGWVSYRVENLLEYVLALKWFDLSRKSEGLYIHALWETPTLGLELFSFFNMLGVE